MFPKYDLIVCTNVYHRTSTIKDYMEAFLANTKKETKYHIYFVVNYDEQWPKGAALDDMDYALNQVDWIKYGMEQFDGKQLYSILCIPNIGLSGFNIGLEIGKTLNYTPVLCINDDTLPCLGWEKLLTYPKIAIREGKEVPIREETIGVLAPTYINCGSMKFQQFIKNKNHFTWGDYVVGHAQLITPHALKKNFRYDSEQCQGWGAYDIFQSMKILSLELNLIINHGVGFDFPNSEESHFHEFNPEKFHVKLDPLWKEMQNKMETFQKNVHIKKYGFNKWYFE